MAKNTPFKPPPSAGKIRPAVAQRPAPAPTPTPAGTAPVIKVNKTYSLNPAEIEKIEQAIDFHRARGIRNVSKAAVVRAWIRRGPIDDALLAETARDHQD